VTVARTTDIERQRAMAEANVYTAAGNLLSQINTTTDPRVAAAAKPLRDAIRRRADIATTGVRAALAAPALGRARGGHCGCDSHGDPLGCDPDCADEGCSDAGDLRPFFCKVMADAVAAKDR
jgi:hypothetical protein